MLPTSSVTRFHHGEVVSNQAEVPMVSEEMKRIFRKHFSEAWYEEKCAQWKMDTYVWDIEQFRYNYKRVSGDYSYIMALSKAAGQQ